MRSFVALTLRVLLIVAIKIKEVSLCMFSQTIRLRLQEILSRVANGQEISLQERLYLDKFADRDQKVSSWFKRALRLQQQNKASNGIDELLADLDLCSPDPQSIYHPEEDDLGEWFGGAPSWLGRS